MMLWLYIRTSESVDLTTFHNPDFPKDYFFQKTKQKETITQFSSKKRFSQVPAILTRGNNSIIPIKTVILLYLLHFSL